MLDVTHGRLQTESDGKEILDDRVVQVAGNALPVFLECDAAQAFLKSQRRHRGASGNRKEFRGRLVVRREPTRLLGEVEIAEDSFADPDRHPEEGVHQRMILREPNRIRVIADLIEAEGYAVAGDRSEHTGTTGIVGDPLDVVFVHPDRNEVDERAVLADDADRAVAGTGELDGRIDGRPEQG